MSQDVLPQHVLNFVRDYIESVEQLEILLLLFHRQDRGWTEEEVAKELRCSQLSAGKRLAQFAQKHILIFDQSLKSYRYSSAEETITTPISALAAAYQVRRVAIIDLIFSKPIDKIQVFADAFKLREDKD